MEVGSSYLRGSTWQSFPHHQLFRRFHPTGCDTTFAQSACRPSEESCLVSWRAARNGRLPFAIVITARAEERGASAQVDRGLEVVTTRVPSHTAPGHGTGCKGTSTRDLSYARRSNKPLRNTRRSEVQATHLACTSMDARGVGTRSMSEQDQCMRTPCASHNLSACVF